jgi:hypothetical protein
VFLDLAGVGHRIIHHGVFVHHLRRHDDDGRDRREHESAQGGGHHDLNQRETATNRTGAA